MERKNICIIGAVGIVFVLFAWIYWNGQPKEPITATAFKLNTVVTVTIYDSHDETLLEEVMAVCDTYEKIFSRTLMDSELYRLNHRTLPMMEDRYVVSEPLRELMDKGLFYGRLSGGAFDITIAPVASLWDFTSGKKVVPDSQQIENARSLVNYQYITLDEKGLRFEKEEMGLDLGAVAKGYIADQMKTYLVSKGVESAIINLGGNVLCIGSHVDGTPFKVGLRRPFAGRDEIVGTMSISDKSVVTSGIYERYFEKDGIFYHHILNPKTGRPYENDLVSVTIISDQSVDGDGLSTACYALGLEAGLQLANSLADIQAVFLTKDGEFHFTDNFSSEIPLTYEETQK